VGFKDGGVDDERRIVPREPIRVGACSSDDFARYNVQGLREIIDDVPSVLESDRQSHEAIGNAGGLSLATRDVAVRH
jgi:hypothetical protein